MIEMSYTEEGLHPVDFRLETSTVPLTAILFLNNNLPLLLELRYPVVESFIVLSQFDVGHLNQVLE